MSSQKSRAISGSRLVAVALAAICLCGGGSQAYANVIASNYASSYSTWADGSNQSTNFGAWNLSNNNNNGTSLFAGYFLGDSTSGAGNINTGGQSFAMFANPSGAFADAIMPLNGQLTAGRSLKFDMGVNFNNGAKGFSLVAANGSEILNWNLGGVTSTSTNFTKTETTAQYDYGGPSALDVELSLTAADQLAYTITRTSTQGIQGTLYQGTISSIVSPPASLKFYISGTDAGGNAANNLYFNSVEVVPEPSLAWAGLAIPVYLGLRRVRRRLAG